MPTINRTPIHTTPQRQRIRDKALDIHKMYSSQRWRNIRDSWLQLHPFCERCQELAGNGTITVPNAATEVHHIKPISTAQDGQEMALLAFDYNNLMGVCHDCHIALHKELGKWDQKGA